MKKKELPTRAFTARNKPELCCSACTWASDADLFPVALAQMTTHIRVQHKAHGLSQTKIRALRRAWNH